MTIYAWELSRITTCVWFRRSEELQAYLLGLRGVLAVQTLLWIFCSTFVPATLTFSGSVAPATGFSALLGRGLSVIFFNPYLISTAAIILSGRMIPVSYLQKPSRQSLAGPMFRRTIRLGLPTTFALIMIYGISLATENFRYIEDFAEQSGIELQRPYMFPNALALFNSVFATFWTQIDISSQAANLAFPTQTLWIISLVYMQSYTIYMAQLIVPYTRTAWRTKMFIILIVLAWWVQSWAWYSITGLLLADVSINTTFKTMAANGLRFRRVKLPTWTLFAIMSVVGLLLQLLWVDWKPQYQWYEIYGHSENYFQHKGTIEADQLGTGKPTARMDAFLVMLGCMLMTETEDWIQWVLSWHPLVAVGRRSFSMFLTAPIIAWTVCVKVWMHLHSKGFSNEAASAMTFLVFLSVIAIVQELFYWLVDKTSKGLASWMWEILCV